MGAEWPAGGRFALRRSTGRMVAHGVQFPTGVVALVWLTYPYDVRTYSTFAAIDRRSYDVVDWLDRAAAAVQP
jgi:hypothetical protein